MTWDVVSPDRLSTPCAGDARDPGRAQVVAQPFVQDDLVMGVSMTSDSPGCPYLNPLARTSRARAWPSSVLYSTGNSQRGSSFMNERDLGERRAFDFRILNDMRCESFDFEAYRTTADLEQRRRPVVDSADGSTAAKYCWIFKVKTPISRDQFAAETEIGVDTDAIGYPFHPPQTWVMSGHVPWSPHFMINAPICIGPELWRPMGGAMMLGELVINLAHLLNWDTNDCGPGYVGWNGAAVEHHRNFYGGRPIDPHLVYPALPSWLAPEPFTEVTFGGSEGHSSERP
jgi:hypothetical protein